MDAQRRDTLSATQLPLMPDGGSNPDMGTGRPRSRGLDHLVAVLTLVRRGSPIVEVGQALGLTPGQVRVCLRLAALNATLRAAVQDGTLPLSLALKAARYPAGVQDRLVSVLATTGRLSQDDIVAAAGGASTAAQLLPLEPLPGPSATTSSPPDELENTPNTDVEQEMHDLVYEPADDRPPEDWWLTD